MALTIGGEVADLCALLRWSNCIKEEEGAAVICAMAASRKKRAREAEVLQQHRGR
jgi:hypothetical protein